MKVINKPEVMVMNLSFGDVFTVCDISILEYRIPEDRNLFMLLDESVIKGSLDSDNCYIANVFDGCIELVSNTLLVRKVDAELVIDKGGINNEITYQHLRI